MTDMPLISVIVPVYGAEEYLDQCIGSLVGQTYRNLEILLLDDASPGNSGAICDRWAQQDPRIKVIHKENSGTGATRNMGMDIARGDLIAFLDCDDYVHPRMYEHLYSLMDAETDIAECGYVKVYDDNAPFDDSISSAAYYTAVEAMGSHVRETAFCQLVWNKLYRREVVADVRFIPEERMDDEFFTYRVLARARKLVSSGKVCHAYRQREGSIVHQKFSVKRVEGLIARQRRLAFIRENMPELETVAREELIMACILMMQESIQSLSGEERAAAESIIYDTLHMAMPLDVSGVESTKRKALLWLAQRNLKATAAMMNFLYAIHLLS